MRICDCQEHILNQVDFSVYLYLNIPFQHDRYVNGTYRCLFERASLLLSDGQWLCMGYPVILQPLRSRMD
jgi:hypothetical protein